MINYVIGDATKPKKGPAKKAPEPHVIAHCCNNIGAWGAGFVMALSKMSRKPERKYRDWANGRLDGGAPMELGNVQLVRLDVELYVANMIGQTGIYERNGVPPIRYDAIETCLNKVGSWTWQKGGSIHMPRIGCGLAGGDWAKMEEILLRGQAKNGNIPMYVYDLC